MPRRRRRATYTRPHGVRLGIVLDNFSPHLSARTDRRVTDWAASNNVELAHVLTNGSWLNRVEAQFQALRYFTLDGTDHASQQQQASMIRRYIAWRNQHGHNQRLRQSSTGRRLPDAPLAQAPTGPRSQAARAVR